MFTLLLSLVSAHAALDLCQPPWFVAHSSTFEQLRPLPVHPVLHEQP